jgi:hypothetical protein
MLIIGGDFHTRYQQIAMASDESREFSALVFFRTANFPTARKQ